MIQTLLDGNCTGGKHPAGGRSTPGTNRPTTSSHSSTPLQKIGFGYFGGDWIRMENVLKRISLGGRTYSWTGKTWVDVETFTYPSVFITKKLNAILLSRLKGQDEKITDVQELLDKAREAKDQTQYYRAEGLARRALQLSPGNIHAVAVLCSCLRYLSKPEETLKESTPYKSEEYPPLITTRAAALCDLKRWEEAKTEIGRLFSMQKKNDSWNYSLPFRLLYRIRKSRPDLFKE
jgi:hypothetical protein